VLCCVVTRLLCHKRARIWDVFTRRRTAEASSWLVAVAICRVQRKGIRCYEVSISRDASALLGCGQ